MSQALDLVIHYTGNFLAKLLFKIPAAVAAAAQFTTENYFPVGRLQHLFLAFIWFISNQQHKCALLHLQNNTFHPLADTTCCRTHSCADMYQVLLRHITDRSDKADKECGA